MSDWQETQRKAADVVKELLALPDPETEPEIGSDDTFCPWSLFPAIYGTYSSAFDDVALDVLEALRGGAFPEETLAHEMFREMLCTANLCDYGTSPRVCFATPEFREVLPELIARWRSYRKLAWEY
jgi:hypothetical protein